MLPPIAIARILPISKKDFYRQYINANKPVVITGLVNDWPALKRWSWDYFANNFGDIEAGVFRLKDGECDANTYRGSLLQQVPVSEAVAAIAQGKLNDGWAIASSAEVFGDAIQQDYSAPVYCAGGAFLRSRVFIGPKGTITSLHQDLPENIYVMVKGTKRITLFEPFGGVYPNSRFSKLPNHSQVDVENPDYDKFPRLKKAQPYTVDLVAGETLFLPSFWWHHLRNLEPSMAVNFWWSQGWKLPIAWSAAMYKKYRGI